MSNKPTDKYSYCNHHHELTKDHEMVDFGDGEFVANKKAIPLLEALSKVGLRTRTHQIDNKHGFVGIIMDNVSIEVRKVNEIHADRKRFNGKTELLISWEIIE